MNAVRSAMAEAIARHYFGKSIYVQSAGVRKSEADAFTASILAEIGIDGSKHKPRTLQELEEWEGLNFDLIISLSPEAHHAALELTRTIAAEVEYWPTPDPTITQGSREQVLAEVLDLVQSVARDWQFDAPLTERTRLYEDLAFESLDLVVLGAAVQERFGQTFPFPDLFATVGQRETRDLTIGEWVDFLEQHLIDRGVPAAARAEAGGV